MGEGHVSRLILRETKVSAFARTLLQKANHLNQRNGVRVSEIENLMLTVELKSGQYPINNIINESVVAQGTSITKDGDFSALVN